MLEATSIPFADLDTILRDEWFTLAHTTGADLSMAPQWFASTIRARGVENRARVLSVFDQGRLVGVAPYMQGSEHVTRVQARSRELPGSYLVAYHPEIVSSIDVYTVLEMLVANCTRACDVLVLPNVVYGGGTSLAALELVRRRRLSSITRPGHASPYLSIDTDWQRFVSAKSKKFRYKLRSALHELESVGTLLNRWFSRTDEIDALFEDILRVEENSWKASKGMAINNTEMERVYYAQLLPFLASQSALHANVLYLDSAPIAYSLCYLSHGCARQLKTSFDQRFAELSPGAVAHRFAIERAFEIGAHEFDFLGDPMLHKTHWANGIREHVSIYIFLPTVRGSILYNARRLAVAIRRTNEHRRHKLSGE